MTERSRSEGFASTLLDIHDRVAYRRVDVTNPADPALSLRYQAYRREGFVDENEAGIVLDKYDNDPNAHTLGVFIDDRLAGSIRLHAVTPENPQSPSRSIWPELLDPITAAGQCYIDPSRFTVDKQASLEFPAMPFLTLRLAVLACTHFHAHWCLSSVRPEHGAFYRRVFAAKQIGEMRSFAGLNFGVVLCITDIIERMRPTLERFPFFMSTPHERQQLFEGHGSYPILPSHRLAEVRSSLSQRYANELDADPVLA